MPSSRGFIRRRGRRRGWRRGWGTGRVRSIQHPLYLISVPVPAPPSSRLFAFLPDNFLSGVQADSGSFVTTEGTFADGVSTTTRRWRQAACQTEFMSTLLVSSSLSLSPTLAELGVDLRWQTYLRVPVVDRVHRILLNSPLPSPPRLRVIVDRQDPLERRSACSCETQQWIVLIMNNEQRRLLQRGGISIVMPKGFSTVDPFIPLIGQLGQMEEHISTASQSAAMSCLSCLLEKISSQD